MWIFLSDAFISIVEDQRSAKRLLVRARLPGDLERVFPGARVKETPDADYRYRASVPRARVAEVIADSILEIDYPNFKASVAAEDKERSSAYMNVWAAMHQSQTRAHRRPFRRPSSCAQCDYDEAEGFLMNQCKRCKAVDALRGPQPFSI